MAEWKWNTEQYLCQQLLWMYLRSDRKKNLIATKYNQMKDESVYEADRESDGDLSGTPEGKHETQECNKIAEAKSGVSSVMRNTSFLVVQHHRHTSYGDAKLDPKTTPLERKVPIQKYAKEYCGCVAAGAFKPPKWHFLRMIASLQWWWGWWVCKSIYWYSRRSNGYTTVQYNGRKWDGQVVSILFSTLIATKLFVVRLKHRSCWGWPYSYSIIQDRVWPPETSVSNLSSAACPPPWYFE